MKVEHSKASRTTEGLRDVLFDEIDAIRSGKSEATRCNAVARATETIIDVVRLEMQLLEFDRKINGDEPPKANAPACLKHSTKLGSPANA